MIIEKESFYKTSIEIITLPPSLTMIGESAFQGCSNLRRIEILEESELQTIGKYAFYGTSIRSFWIPSHTTNIGKSAFDTSTLQIIEINDNIELTIDTSMFSCYSSNLIILTPIKL